MRSADPQVGIQEARQALRFASASVGAANHRSRRESVGGQNAALASLFLPGEPIVHASLENVERQRSRLKHHVVEIAEIELVAQRLFRSPPQLFDFQLPDLVGQRLSRY